jgi:thiol:disulfide interchange protein DsbD
VLLRQGGEALGWGFHLQNPIFVALLVGLFFLMGLSLLGLFEMGLGAVGGGRKGAFLSGMVTTLAAAVCIGPLLGPVFGAAALLPATQAVLLYTTVGIGMAIPYLLLAAVPQWLKWLPKPGEWLHVLQQIFGFMMLAAALWLLWVFDGQTSAGQTVFLCAWLLPLAVAAWLFGRWGHAGRARRSRLIAGVIAAALAVTSVTGLISTARITTHSQELQAYQPYSKERLATLRSENKPVFIDVTARWCLICQSNRSALHDSKVLAMAKEKGITLLEADYTNSDPAIGELLREHGRDGVPLYLLYAPNKPAKILPQSLKSDLLVSEFSKL